MNTNYKKNPEWLPPKILSTIKVEIIFLGIFKGISIVINFKLKK